MSIAQVVDNIYVSISSYCDQELSDTVYSLFKNSQNKDRIFVSVLSQDEDYNHPDLDSLFKFFNTKNYVYKKEHYTASTGVGYARKKAQEYLDNTFKYYLQIDSHTQFSKNWDQKIIEEYQTIHSQWGKSILSTYPPAYDNGRFGENMLLSPNHPYPPIVRIVSNDSPYRFEAKYKNFEYSNVRQYTGYFCAGQAFGYSEYFLEVPYDEKIAFQGEEHTMSIRFYDKGIKIICPNEIFLFHNYKGDKRKRNWENNPFWQRSSESSENRLSSFFEGTLLDGFSVSKKSIENWIKEFVENLDSQPKPPRLS